MGKNGVLTFPSCTLQQMPPWEGWWGLHYGNVLWILCSRCLPTPIPTHTHALATYTPHTHHTLPYDCCGLAFRQQLMCCKWRHGATGLYTNEPRGETSGKADTMWQGMNCWKRLISQDQCQGFDQCLHGHCAFQQMGIDLSNKNYMEKVVSSPVSWRRPVTEKGNWALFF